MLEAYILKQVLNSKKSILDYQKGEHHQRALDLMVNSYTATGEEDSVQFSLNLISKLYPSLDYKKYGFFKENTAKRDLSWSG